MCPMNVKSGLMAITCVCEGNELIGEPYRALVLCMSPISAQRGKQYAGRENISRKNLSRETERKEKLQVVVANNILKISLHFLQGGCKQRICPRKRFQFHFLPAIHQA